MYPLALLFIFFMLYIFIVVVDMGSLLPTDLLTGEALVESVSRSGIRSKMFSYVSSSHKIGEE